MRLIDADALMKQYEGTLFNKVQNGFIFVPADFTDLIDNAPTIELTDTDLISRADAIEALSRSSIYVWSTEQDQTAHDWALNIIKKLPSADAVSREQYQRVVDTVANLTEVISSMVKVVLCKDCRHYKKINPRAKSGMCYKDIVASAWNDDGFCSRGERREP